jgi:TRAP-type C4-dicarboxylate transport system substrate-binding protein
MKRLHSMRMASAAILLTGGLSVASQAADIELHGASQFNDTHAFNKALLKFEAETKACYNKPIKFVLHRNSELGLEKEYFNFMSKGVSVDYAIVAPSHMSTYSKKAPLMDMPFLFRDLAHWNKVLDGGGLAPLAADVEKRADVKLIGYAGGGTRNLIVNKPVRNMSDLKGLPMRVMGAPIQTRIFTAIGAAPTVIAYAEVYNAIQTGVIKGAENEAAGIEQMKFYEVGPEISLTQHAITVRPIGFSGKTFRKLPKDLQACIEKAGKIAGKHGREIESSQDAQKLAKMEKDGKLKTHVFVDRAKLLQLAEPVKKAYAAELGATDVLNKISGTK